MRVFISVRSVFPSEGVLFRGCCLFSKKGEVGSLLLGLDPCHWKGGGGPGTCSDRLDVRFSNLLYLNKEGLESREVPGEAPSILPAVR